MKAVQVLFDEELLARLSESPDVKQKGRSEIVRRAVHMYLIQQERERISEAYRNAYSGTRGLGEEFDGWTEEGQWPGE